MAKSRYRRSRNSRRRRTRRRSLHGGFGFSQGEKDSMKAFGRKVSSGVGSAWSGIKSSTNKAIDDAKVKFQNYQARKIEDAAVNALAKLKDSQQRAQLRTTLRSGTFGGGRRRSRRRSRRSSGSSGRRRRTRRRSTRRKTRRRSRH